MPANRNDITKKPIMTTAPTKNAWTAVDKMGKFHVIWANTREEAEAHATSNDWTITHEKE